MSKQKKVWVRVNDYDREFITGCLEAGVDGIYSTEPVGEQISQLGVVKTITPDGDLRPGEEVTSVKIEGKEDEEEVLKQANEKFVIVQTSDWMVIPLENLIARTDNLIASVGDAEEALVALETLEQGVDGVLLETDSLAEVRETVDELKGGTEEVNLQAATVTSVKKVGMGDRVCVDTGVMMEAGEGMLVGNSSSGMFLVSAEVKKSEYVASRPFRVNAGGVHAYIRIPGNETCYLSELQSGDDVMIFNSEGEGKSAVVGRTKLEKRPMMLLEAEISSGDEKQTVSLLLQNAETINLIDPEGQPVSVVRLEPGDEVLALHEKGGRHFGVKVEETIQEN